MTFKSMFKRQHGKPTIGKALRLGLSPMRAMMELNPAYRGIQAIRGLTNKNNKNKSFLKRLLNK